MTTPITITLGLNPWLQIKNAFGEEFLRYVLVKDDIPDELSINSLTPEQNRAFQALLQYSNLASRCEHQIERSDIFGRLFLYVDELGATTAEHLRISCGGAAPEIHEDDPVTHHVLKVAAELYASFLVGLSSYLVSGYFDHSVLISIRPSLTESCRLILQDQSLSKLFPGAGHANVQDADELYSIRSEVFFTAFTSGYLSLAALPGSVCVAAWRNCLIAGRIELNHFLHETKLILGKVRNLADGLEIEVPLVVGLSNIALEDSVAVELEKAQIVHSNSHLAKGIFGLAEAVEKSEVLLVMQAPLRVVSVQRRRGKEDPYAKFDKAWKDYRQKRQDEILAVRFSMVLASKDALLSPIPTFEVMFNPLEMNTGGWGNSSPTSPTPAAAIDAEVARRIEDWSGKISAVELRSIRIGVRRLISAVTSRFDPGDALVDAVICWENLFGASGEAVFRVTGAMAKILEADDSNRRNTLVKVLKKIYGVRSDLVHGNQKDYSDDVLRSNSDKAIRYALDVMRIVLTNSDLMAQPDSTSRGTFVLLN